MLVGVVVIVPVGGYLFARLGGIAMATMAQPLPLEKTLDKTALHACLGDAAKMVDPWRLTEANATVGAQVYIENCAVCHGLPEQPKTRITMGEFPSPPQLFVPHEIVTSEPEGVT